MICQNPYYIKPQTAKYFVNMIKKWPFLFQAIKFQWNFRQIGPIKKNISEKKEEPNDFKKRQNSLITLLPRWNLYTIYERTFIALAWTLLKLGIAQKNFARTCSLEICLARFARFCSITKTIWMISKMILSAPGEARALLHLTF